MAAWAPWPLDLDVETVGAGHHRAAMHGDLAEGQAGPVVQAEHRLHGKTLEQPVGDHRRRTALAFFGGLEQKHHGAVEIGFAARCAAAPSSMAVWPSWPQACIRPGWREWWLKSFFSWMGSASMSARRPMLRPLLPALSTPDNAGLAHAGVGFDTQGTQALGHEGGGAVLLKGQFRMGVDVPADGGDLGVIGPQFFQKVHDASR
jgi:hypothetical protein